MCSTYDLVEEDYVHKTPLSSTNIVNQKESINTVSSVNDLVVEEHIEETPFISTNNDDQYEISTTNYSTNEIFEKDFIHKTSLSSFKNIVIQQENTTKIFPIKDFCSCLQKQSTMYETLKKF